MDSGSVKDELIRRKAKKQEEEKEKKKMNKQIIVGSREGLIR